jgi:hypothetical protein
MNRRTKMLETLTMYFMEKGRMLSKREYKQQADRPYRIQAVTAVFPSWAAISRQISRNFPQEYEQLTEFMKGPTEDLGEMPESPVAVKIGGSNRSMSKGSQ